MKCLLTIPRQSATCPWSFCGLTLAATRSLGDGGECHMDWWPGLWKRTMQRLSDWSFPCQSHNWYIIFHISHIQLGYTTRNPWPVTKMTSVETNLWRVTGVKTTKKMVCWQNLTNNSEDFDHEVGYWCYFEQNRAVITWDWHDYHEWNRLFTHDSQGREPLKKRTDKPKESG